MPDRETDKTDPAKTLRIGELSRRVGVSEPLLRAWQTRYGLLEPARSPGGYRLYSERDEQRVREMCAHLARGLSAAEAARATLAAATTVNERPIPGPAVDGGSTPASGLVAELGVDRHRAMPASGLVAELAGALARALTELDEPAAQAVFDRMLGELTLPAALRDIVVPYLGTLGACYARGEITVGDEHFASQVVRGRLAGLARGWGAGIGPRLLLACPPGERHELGLMIFGIVANRRGWRVSYLGADTPIDSVGSAAERVRPDLVVLAASAAEHLNDVRTDLARLAAVAPVALAGTGASTTLADDVGARFLDADPVTAAEALAPSALATR